MIRKSILKTSTLVATLSVLLSCAAISSNSITVQAASMMSSQDVVQNMGVGWNLGNTLDSIGSSYSMYSDSSLFETYWKNPVTTKAMIDKIKAAGFKTIRVPVSWGEHMEGAPNYKVAASWLKRVKEVVDYCIDDGLFVILNVHHDSSWCIPNTQNENNVKPKLEKLWTQIANYFKNYDSHLIFETLNEPRVIGSSTEWSGGLPSERAVVNRYNQTALKAIRATGGNNKDRSVMMPTYGAAATQEAINDYVVPNDSHVIVSLHAYSPYYFAMDTKSQYATRYWGSDNDKRSLSNELDVWYNKFVARGIPVVIGEFGSTNKDNLDSRERHAKYYVSEAKKRKIACVWWDNNSANVGEENFGIFNRSALSWYFPTVKDALINGYNSVYWGNQKPDPKPEPTPEPTPSEEQVPGTTVTLKDGWYYIKNVNAQKYLQVTDNLGKANQNVELRSGTGSQGQKWYLKNVGNGYVTLKSALGNFMLDVASAKNENGTNIGIYNSHSGNAQQFMLKTSSTNGAYVIATKASNITKVLDDYNFSKADGTNVCQWAYGGKANQQWLFEVANSSDPKPEPTPTPTPSSKLKLDYNINNWGSGYQVNFKISNNTSSTVSNWTLKLKKSEIKITSSWNVTLKESGDYYIITPISWNSTITKGNSIEFGVQGAGKIGDTLSYTLN
ncbi:MAG: hypothetical protein E7214_02080 [Clostridium sp.]|nr:hypothetical protein [Clostridium sp.]